MAEKTWTEFFFGTEEDRKRAKKVLKEMRPDYERPGEKKAEKKAVIDRRAPWTSAEAKVAKQAVVRTGKGDREAAKREGMSVNRGGKTDMAPPKPKLQPERKTPPKAKPAAKRVAFKGNWVGAAPTAMQARAGQRIKRPNLKSLLKGK